MFIREISAFNFILIYLFFTFQLGSTDLPTSKQLEADPSDDPEVLYQCDHVFDSSKPQGTFSFPFPPSFSSKQKKKLKEDPRLFDNIQCIFTFVAGQRQRVKLEFDDFQLSGTAENCDLEYVDIYSELKSPSDDLLSFMTPSRYCGTVSPHIRISLHNVLVLVFHSRVGAKRTDKLKLNGRYQFISNARYIPGRGMPNEPCSFVIDAANKRKGSIFSPTYPGTYPSNFHCRYLLTSDSPYDRIHLSFRDFDIYFGGEHCPYDMMTVYDGDSNKDIIIRKVCGLQQNLEVFSIGPVVLLEFNTTEPAKNDPRGFVIDYEFSDSYVNVKQLLDNQKGVTHLQGTECDVRVQSSRETTHYIQSPNYPEMYPPKTTCTYIIDGLQGDQNLEKVVLHFEELAVFSETSDFAVPTPTEIASADQCESSFVGVAVTESSMKAVMVDTLDSWYDVTLCERLNGTHDRAGPYISEGPRMILVFGSLDLPQKQENKIPPLGFRARIEFKTDFGIPGEAVGDSNKCLFRFRARRGSFNSPRYPDNYPLDTNCTYYIQGQPGDQILLYFEQFALFEEDDINNCDDWVEVYDIMKDESGVETAVLQAKHCWTVFPGPTISTFGSHELRVVFSSNSFGTANGFKAFYEIRRSFKEDVPSKEGSDSRHCGHRIAASDSMPSGFFTSPGFPVKYNKDLACDWEITARPGHQILLKLTKMEVEGEITETKVNCKNAIIRIQGNESRISDHNICGTNPDIMKPMVSVNESIRINFMTSPEKVNGLKGFNFSWTEVKLVSQDAECHGDNQYLCSYTRLCINSILKCDGDANCGENDDTDEAHCNIAEKDADKKTVIIAAIFSFGIFLFISSVFCYLFVTKYQRKRNKARRKLLRPQNSHSHSNGAPRPPRQRQPYRSHQPVGRSHPGESSEEKDLEGFDGFVDSSAISRYVNHDAIGQVPAANSRRSSSVKPHHHHHGHGGHHSHHPHHGHRSSTAAGGNVATGTAGQTRPVSAPVTAAATEMDPHCTFYG
uniref:CUB domain-containing protein n=1 Tax=Panagrellus redivivus TaxID=6233 RepID=A0A7E4UN52_PANRE